MFDEGDADAEVPADVVFVGFEVFDNAVAEAESEVGSGEDGGEEYAADSGHRHVVSQVEGHGDVAVVEVFGGAFAVVHLGGAVFVHCGEVNADVDDGDGEFCHCADCEAAAVVAGKIVAGKINSV